MMQCAFCPPETATSDPASMFVFEMGPGASERDLPPPPHSESQTCWYVCSRHLVEAIQRGLRVKEAATVKAS